MRASRVLRAASLAIKGREGLFERCREQFAYGHIDWIRKQVGLAPEFFVVARLLHAGWSLPSAQTSLSPFRSPFGKRLPILTWNKAWERAYKDSAIPEATAVGSPWLYMLKSMGLPTVWADFKQGTRTLKPESWLAKPRSILFVPVHSWERDVVNLTARIDALESHLPPAKTTVLLGWGDYLSMETTHTFQARGYQVVCAGYRGGAVSPASPVGDRSMFLLNLAKIFLRHEVVVSDIPCTALVYASSIGLPVHIDPHLRSLRDNWLMTLISDHSTSGDFSLTIDWEEQDPLWDSARDCPSHLDAATLAERLGGDSLVPPKQWRQQFKWARI